MPSLIDIAEKGIDIALKEISVLRGALNFYRGELVNEEVEKRQGLKMEQL